MRLQPVPLPDVDPDDVTAWTAAMEARTALTNVPDVGVLDLRELWSTEPEPVDWLAEPLIARGRLVALYSLPKAGKSLLALEIAAAIATGGRALGHQAGRGRVLYVDLENDPRGDIVDRLLKMGHTPDVLDALRVVSFPILPPLDTAAGGRALHALARREGVDLVIIDTVSRTIEGDENDNRTWLNWYRHTGLPLKRDGIACLRLDHAGKDATKGQRGGSAKSSDADAVWKLTATGNTVRLTCDVSRQPLDDDARTLTLHRLDRPLRHEPALDPRAAVRNARVANLVAALDRLDLPPDTGRDKASVALREAGHTFGTDDLREALTKRRNLTEVSPGQVTPEDLTEPPDPTPRPEDTNPLATPETAPDRQPKKSGQVRQVSDLTERPPSLRGAAPGQPTHNQENP